MATTQVEAGDLHFTAIRNIACAAVAIQLWTNYDVRGLILLPRESEEGRESLTSCHHFFTNNEEWRVHHVHSCLLVKDSFIATPG